jgi:hypothetical protein
LVSHRPPLLDPLMTEAPSTPERSVLKSATRRNIPDDTIQHSLTYTSTAKEQLCKQALVQQPLLCNSSVGILFPEQREKWHGRDNFSAVRAGAM